MNLLGLDASGLTAFFTSQGESAFRARQVLRWIHRLGQADFDAMTDMAKSLRAKLKSLARVDSPKLLADRASKDESRKFLFELDGGDTVETVFIPDAGRGTLCVSTQAGCALRCAFCSTGRQGFVRNLSAAEIVGQLWRANRILGALPSGDRIVSNVVLMGMGEPLLNFDPVVSAIRLMLDDNAYGFSRRRVTVSTAGVVPGIDRLREECPVALAVSLHAPNDALRDTLMPINRKYPLASLMGACERYLAKAPRDFITFEYVLLDGVNDSEAHARELLSLAGGLPCKFNLIPFNPFPGAAFARPPAWRVRNFAAILMDAGRVTTTRRARGDDIGAACGQLAGRARNGRVGGGFVFQEAGA